MGRTKNAPNLTNYHYKIDFLDDDGETLHSVYHYTAKEIQEVYGCSRATIYNKIRLDHVKPKKFKNMKISKVLVPVFIKVENPNVISE
tara:strand:+ start:4448 stop:4711 length:264 start_codon:yes stop_codon:yes gene_type:complete